MDVVSMRLSLVMMGAIGAAIGIAVPSAGRAAHGAPARFTLCPYDGGTNCVVRGDTAWIYGTKVRVADIDAPETHPPRCALEARLSDAATRRLAELMNAGPLQMAPVDRD